MGRKPLELLAPAKNLELGIAAVNHGADAVYIGAGQFSARMAAGNPLEDIEKLAAHARQYNARVYAAMNTILFDHELEKAGRLIRRLWDAGAHAIIIQDMGLLEMDLPPIPLFASTQADNRLVHRVKFLEENGFARVILARELGLPAIRKIRKATSVDLEAFVHGALCVCYSGQCYLSAAIGGRSANRGQCGQPCRLSWNLVAEKGRVVEKEKYLLSLKDMDRSQALGELADAGISSFKIEGRLKNLAYVKNITALYRKKLDALIEKGPEYASSSSGKVFFSFAPDPAKTFTRGATEYFLHGRGEKIHGFDTPKSMGEKIGQAAGVEPQFFTLDLEHDIANGDGLCFMDGRGKLRGFNVNRVEGRKIYPAGRINLEKSGLGRGTMIFRNHDHNFLKILAGNTSQRRLVLDLVFRETGAGFVLEGIDEDGIHGQSRFDTLKTKARDGAKALATIEKQLGKLGDSIFYLRKLTLAADAWFLPVRELNRLRRKLVDDLEKKRAKVAAIPQERQGLSGQSPPKKTNEPRPGSHEPFPNFPKAHLDFTANIANEKARTFYEKRGVKTIEPAFELCPPESFVPLMTLKHCIRYSLGLCPEKGDKAALPLGEALYLENEKGRFALEFDCKKCEMKLTGMPGK